MAYESQGSAARNLDFDGFEDGDGDWGNLADSALGESLKESTKPILRVGEAANDNVEYGKLTSVGSGISRTAKAPATAQPSFGKDVLSPEDRDLVGEFNLDSAKHHGTLREKVALARDLLTLPAKGMHRQTYINRLRGFRGNSVAEEMIKQLQSGHGDMNAFRTSALDAIRYGAFHLSEGAAMAKYEESRADQLFKPSAKSLEIARATVGELSGLSPFPDQNGQRIDDAVAGYRVDQAKIEAAQRAAGLVRPAAGEAAYAKVAPAMAYPEPRTQAAQPEAQKTSMWSRAMNKVSSLAESAKDTVGDISSLIAAKARNVMSRGTEIIGTTLNKVAEKAAPTVDSVASSVKSGIAKVGNFFKSFGRKTEVSYA